VRNVDGHCRNVFDGHRIPGGSSSGSAVAVASGQVAFSIGTDTGGSGRVPAACNNIVGLKPTPGVVSTHGFVHNNRSFDVASVLALQVNDAYRVLDVLIGHDPRDLYSSTRPLHGPTSRALPPAFRFAVPRAAQLDFFGDAHAAAAWGRALRRLQARGGEAVEIDCAPLREAGELLFDSPLAAERWLSYGPTLLDHPATVHPAVAQALQRGHEFDAAQAYATAYRLRELRQAALAELADIAFLALPTCARIPLVSEVEADPQRLNAQMGRYTAFANPLGLFAVSVPAGLRDDGLPFGLSLVGRGHDDLRLQPWAAAVQNDADVAPGAPAVGRDSERAALWHRSGGVSIDVTWPATAGLADRLPQRHLGRDDHRRGTV
jgi:allophanate hydrolase